jgi:predicted hydrolase (HD superfamily)
VAQIMAYFAKKLWEDEEYRCIVGLLHDVDRDCIAKDSSKHLKAEFDMIMDEISAPIELRDDIRSHGYRLTGVPVWESIIRKYLISVDELSGLLHAYSLMRPTKFEWMERSWINKRIKDRTFASGVDREHIRGCEQYLWIPLNEFAMKVVQALQSHI